MPFNPDEKPKEFLTVLVAAGLLIFQPKVFGTAEAFKLAEEFVAEAEKRTGKLNP
jgi:hypothetical protein